MTAVDATRAAFLADVIAHPDDDTPRLIFADWLEEHGEEARAFCIRRGVEEDLPHLVAPGSEAAVEVMLNALDLSAPPQIERVLIAPALDRVSYTVRRGFVHSVTLPAADWLAHADALLRAHPVREVRLLTWPEVEDRVLQPATPGGAMTDQFTLANMKRKRWVNGGAYPLSNLMQGTALDDYLRSVVERLFAAEWPLITFHFPEQESHYSSLFASPPIS